VTTEGAAEYEQIWIPLPDGAVLAGRLWRAVCVDRAPAVLEWIPYRQSDLTAVGDSMLHGWFAQNGLAAVRVDLRGSGNSDGVLTDEYTPQEQDDAVAVIAWIAAQDWCSGAVGMIGISWSGFAALQVAARRPPALKAIITCCSTDDRYRDDVHTMGGALLSDGLQWGAGLFAQMARPPDPAEVGARWRQMWAARLAGLAPPLGIWLAHPERDAYWRHGSVCEDYGAIACPVFAVGGWTDGYPDAVLRLMQHLAVPRRGLIGPWTHMYPNWGMPGPAIGFLQECLGWWRQHLYGESPGAAACADLTLWLGRDLVPGAGGISIGGRWIRVAGWPAEAAVREMRLAGGRLEVGANLGEAGPGVALDTPPHCGVWGGEWCPLDGGGSGPEFQGDQREDDGLSLCFDSEVLSEDVALVGAAVLAMEVSLAGPAGLLAVRLCEVREDGVSARVTFGLLRVRRPEGCAAGARFGVRVALKSVAYVFAAGRRMRLAMSSAYWPMAWPEMVAAGWMVWPGSAVLRLPGLPEGAAAFGGFEEPVAAVAIAHEVVAPAAYARVVRRDVVTGGAALEVSVTKPTMRLGDLVFGASGREVYEIGDGPARVAFKRVQFMRRPDWDVRIESETDFGEAGLRSALRAFLDGACVFDDVWHDSPVKADTHG